MLSKIKLKKLVNIWYNQDDVAEAIFNWIQNREVMGRTIENKVERPLKIQDPNDIKYNNIIVSYHATQEKFSNAAHYEGYSEEISRPITYDITVDIDITYTDKNLSLELSKRITYIIIKFLSNFGIEPIVKFSGRRGFHLIIPEAINSNNLLFEYRYFIHKALIYTLHLVVQSRFQDIISIIDSFSVEDLKKTISIDVKLASPRHMVRVPYSIHEETGYISLIIKPNKVLKFEIEHALPNNAIVIEPKYNVDQKGFMKLIITSLVVMYKYLTATSSERYLLFLEYIEKVKNKKIKGLPKTIPEEELYPPCVKKMLQGVEPGMRNNTMFFLIHFFKKLGKNFDEIQKIIYEWNERNKEPLKEREVDYALKYHWEHDYMPYSCTKIRELFGHEFCQPDEFCTNIKNPIQYPYKKLKLLGKNKNGSK